MSDRRADRLVRRYVRRCKRTRENEPIALAAFVTFLVFFGVALPGAALVKSGTGGGASWQPALYAGLALSAVAGLLVIAVWVNALLTVRARRWAARIRARGDLREVYLHECSPERRLEFEREARREAFKVIDRR
jgi:hypothetical protein